MRKEIILDKKELKYACDNLMSFKKVCNYFGVSETVIRKNLKNFQIKLKIKKFTIEDDIFNKDTENSFYIAGFIAADGCICRNNLSIRLSSNDEDHLKKINFALGSNRNIYNYSGVSALNIHSKKICEDLKRFNIVPRKSLIYTFPEWMKEHPLKHHFMRGYFDGDGSFYINNQYNKKVCMGIRGTSEFLTSYRDILEKECQFKERSYNIPMPSNCEMLAYGGNKNIIKFSNFIYKDATIYMDRKFNISKTAEKLLENLHVK